MKQLAVKTQTWKKDIEQKQEQINNMIEALNYEKILLTKELIKERGDKIKFYQHELLDYQQKRFGPNGDYVIQQQKIIQPLQDKVFYAVNQIAKERRYDFIFDKSADVVMLYSDKRFDISRNVLSRIKSTVKDRGIQAIRKVIPKDVGQNIKNAKENVKKE
ncbi:outer membrane chaperone Skp [Elysia marginata]|uniref:Outer membrane chaperone Skp n=1 Tax=Elysia marginata TaxID=1093978 RepID=A0AAV4GLK8_9GAST|nr:outer membrane chaperone Skp [Elysia marginata]